mmetsp:Transcript_4053/g.6155  ORF Transcript_4053/g.6155 Transcript_4053/m.6155 type:complete len:97 (-) Transcript_4053:180-470(-)
MCKIANSSDAPGEALDIENTRIITTISTKTKSICVHGINKQNSTGKRIVKLGMFGDGGRPLFEGKDYYNCESGCVVEWMGGRKKSSNYVFSKIDML